MATDIISTIKQAEVQAQAVVVNAEEESANIIKQANEKKSVLLKACLDDLKMAKISNENSANIQAEKLKNYNSVEIEKVLSELDSMYNLKKSEAIECILQQIIKEV